jgi:hypothetical protein
VKQRQPLRSNLRTEPAHPRNVPARLIQACDQAVLARVVVAREDNWNCSGSGLGHECRIVSPGCGNHRNLTLDEIGRQHRQSIRMSLSPAIFNRDVLAFDIAGLVQALAERGHHQSERIR